MRRHGWQSPLHPLQMVGIAVYSFLVVAFYTFLGLLLGNRVAEITVTALYSFVAFSVMFLFIRCTAIDPSDKTSVKKKKKKKRKSNGFPKLNYKFILSQFVVRLFRRLERKMLKSFIRRKYFDPLKATAQLEPLLPFPLITKDDSVTPDLKEDDISFCSLCDFEVKRHSKHCRTCNRCVEGFDHHCRWLNNCIGKRNYTTFILMMVFVLLMLIIEGGTAIAIFVRCFADKRGIEQQLKLRLFIKFPREVLATISILLVLMTAYSSAALGQLFFFHVVLIRKGMRTYDYIIAMREENQFAELDPFDDSDLSSDDSDFDSPEKPSFVSRFICRGHEGVNKSPTRLSIRIDGDSAVPKKQGFHVSVDPWKLIKISKDKAILAAEMARESIMKQKSVAANDTLRPLPLETKCGPTMNSDNKHPPMANTGLVSTHLISPGRLSSPRRRFSGSSSMFSGISPSPKQKYRSNFDLKLTEVSRELETYISRQVLCSVIKKDGVEASPR
ncbi:hypothetical protein ACFE04_016456 [Oxalis oulophora]